MRADRLLRLLWILRHERDPVPAGKLAAELEVSTRTVLRDVEALSASGVPVYTERGPHGGIALLAGYRPEVIGLTSDEAFALVAVTSLSTASTLGLHDAAMSAIGKVDAATRTDQVARIRRSSIIDPDGWLPGRRQSWLVETLSAVRQNLMMGFRYTSGSGGITTSVRTPALGLLCAATDWYLAGEASDASTRFYRLDRMDDVELGRPADPRPDFDLEAAWHTARSRFAKRFRAMPALLDIRQEALGKLRAIVTIDRREPETDGWIRVHVTFADITHALEVLPRLAGDLRVHRPTELRHAVQALAERLEASVR